MLIEISMNHNLQFQQLQNVKIYLFSASEISFPL